MRIGSFWRLATHSDRIDTPLKSFGEVAIHYVTALELLANLAARQDERSRGCSLVDFQSEALGGGLETFDAVYGVNRWAMGKRRPTPKALEVTRKPGAACLRLYSLRSTFCVISRTSSSGNFKSRAIAAGS